MQRWILEPVNSILMHLDRWTCITAIIFVYSDLLCYIRSGFSFNSQKKDEIPRGIWCESPPLFLQSACLLLKLEVRPVLLGEAKSPPTTTMGRNPGEGWAGLLATAVPGGGGQQKLPWGGGNKNSLRILPFSKGDFAFFHKTEPEEASMWETFRERPGFNTTLSSVFYRRLNQGRRRWRSHTNGKVCCWHCKLGAAWSELLVNL